MEEKFEQIQRFLTACDELVDGTFHLAEPKIGEALRAIAESRELTNLFAAVTDGYNFAAAKSAYLRAPSEGGARGSAYLPAARNEVLAFVFCLFVELDCGKLRLNEFLLRYFYVDGSYTASYAVFSDRMIKPFRDIVRDCYPDLGRRGQLARTFQRREELFGAIAQKLTEERARVAALELPEADRKAAETLFPALISAAGRRDEAELAALLTGYKYFLRYIDGRGSASAAIFSLMEQLGTV